MAYAATLPCLTTRWYIQNLFQKQNKTPQFFATIHQNRLSDARKLTHGLKWVRPHEKMMMGNDNKTHLGVRSKKIICASTSWSKTRFCFEISPYEYKLAQFPGWIILAGIIILSVEKNPVPPMKISRKTRSVCIKHEGSCHVTIGPSLPVAATRTRN